MIRDAIATPRRADIGTKYVAAEKPNGSVLGNESSCAPGRTIIAAIRKKYNMWKKRYTFRCTTVLQEENARRTNTHGSYAAQWFQQQHPQISQTVDTALSVVGPSD